MEAKTTRKRWTYGDYAHLPVSGSTRYEIIDDELVVTPSPGTRHRRIVAKLLSRILVFAEQHDLGEVFPAPLDVLFAEGDYLEPDILFVSKDHAERLGDRGVEGPTDLVIEVLSPSTAARDRGINLDRYRLNGVAEYWIIDLEEWVVEVWKLAEGGDQPLPLGASDTLDWTPTVGAPTLEIELAELFGD